MASHNLERLKEHIMPLSEATHFELARLEWKFVSIYLQPGGTCPCGHHPITDHCMIRNTKTDYTTTVGNVCVNRFMGIDTSNLTLGLKRIIKDPYGNANRAVIQYAGQQGFIYPREVDFLLQTIRIRKPSAKQREWKRKINWRIINAVMVKETI